MTMDGRYTVPKPVNEPVLSYAPGTPEKKAVKGRLAELLGQEIEIPMIIGGKDVRTGKLRESTCPHDHHHVLAKYHLGGPEELEGAIKAAHRAKADWAAMPWESRAAIFLKAGALLAGKWRQTLNAATMLGQSKTVHQAEIDAACELIDFYRYNAAFATELYGEQPESSQGIWNITDYRPLEGFVLAITPFNFTSIAGNLPTAPALMGNTVIWKPASSAVYSAHFLMGLLKEAGLPDGVINMVLVPGSAMGENLLAHPDLAGIHFTGSTAVFQNMWKVIGSNIKEYRNYPRIVGETGGKDFIVAHASADPKALQTAIVRGSFEYQGQKCSASSRLYVPDSLWATLKDSLVQEIREIRMGDPSNFQNFMGAVIDRKAFTTIKEYIDFAQSSPDGQIICGGGTNDKKGYYIEPTVIETTNPRYRTIQEEIFGPVLTVYVYPEKEYAEALRLCDTASPYALTGAIFSQDRKAVLQAADALRFTAGNFYINDKPTGAVVGQQPFGGSRASGTNDKAGSKMNLMRWVSARTVKETFEPPTSYRYPFMAEE